MNTYKVLSILSVGDNTSVIIDGSGEAFRQGTGITDEKGTPYEVLSVAMSSGKDVGEMMKKAMLLVKGRFDSQKLIVQNIG